MEILTGDACTSAWGRREGPAARSITRYEPPRLAARPWEMRAVRSAWRSILGSCSSFVPIVLSPPSLQRNCRRPKARQPWVGRADEAFEKVAQQPCLFIVEV